MLEISLLRAAYRSGDLTPMSVIDTVLRRVHANTDNSIWISRVPDDHIVERVRQLPSDKSAIDRFPLYGIPFAVKDNIDVARMLTTAACPAFAYTPGKTAHAVERLLDAGAVLIGKTNLDQFATGLVGTRSPYGAPRSVFDSRYISGGSSSGSAVAVASGLVSFALGTDTAGSGRVPAAFNNIVGLKPTRGLVSTSGVVPACRSLDCISVFAASCGDASSVLRVMTEFDHADDFSRPSRFVPLNVAAPLVAILAEADRVFDDANDAALYRQAIDVMRGSGATTVTVDYEPFREAASLLYGPWVAERMASIEAFYTLHAADMDPSVREVVGRAATYTASDVFKAEHRLKALRRASRKAWRDADVLMLPTTPGMPTLQKVQADPIAANTRLGIYTNFVNLLDMSAIAIPAGVRQDGLPFGVTLIGPAFADGDLARIADRLHRDIGAGAGAQRRAPAASEIVTDAPEVAGAGTVAFVVAGAHMTSMSLNHELVDLGGKPRGPSTTAPGYRLFALPKTLPQKPGLVRDTTGPATGIAVEVWELPVAAFGAFVARIPSPLGIGKVSLANGEELSGFICEPKAIRRAKDISKFGGWKDYLASKTRA